MTNRIREDLCERSGIDDLLFLDPPEDFDQAIIGIALRFGGVAVVAYDREKCIEGLMGEDRSFARFYASGGRLAIYRGSNQGIREEAEEWFEFNTIGAWVGERTPIFVERFAL